MTKTKTASIIILLMVLISHLPFLESDADIRMESGSIGAWTDEGLNTSQIRNLVNHNEFDILECDNFLKTPLFSFFHFISMSLLGSGLLTVRLMTLILSLSIFFFAFRKEKNYQLLLLLSLTTFLLFPFHQYAHLSLAETVSVALITVSGILYSNYTKTEEPSQLLRAGILLFLAICFKIQFVYILAILPLVFLFDHLVFKRSFPSKKVFRAVIILAVLFIVIIGIWYLPFRDEWGIIAKQQSGSFSLETISRESLNLNLERYFLQSSYLPFTVTTIILIPTGFLLLFNKNLNGQRKSLLLFSIIWMLLEMHKLPMIYLPSRYVVSLYFSMGLLISVVSTVLIELNYNKWINYTIYTVILILFVQNTRHYKSAYSEREFQIYHANEYLSQHLSSEDVVIGPWAPAFTWKSQSRSMPIWHDFVRTYDLLETFKPRVIVSELNEKDSGEAYRLRGIDLEEISDSSKTYHIAYRDITLYWIKPQYRIP